MKLWRIFPVALVGLIFSLLPGPAPADSGNADPGSVTTGAVTVSRNQPAASDHRDQPEANWHGGPQVAPSGPVTEKSAYPDSHPDQPVISGHGGPQEAVLRAHLRSVNDPTGRQVTLPIAPRRVISLAPAITEMVFALERNTLLVATPEFSNYPPAAKKLPRIGSYIQPDLERIVALRPDLVLATRDGNPRPVIERLERLGIPVYAIDPRNLAEIKTSLLALGEILGAAATAGEITTAMTRRLAEIDRRVAAVAHRPLVFFQIDAEPMVSVGEQTFLHELLVRAGGRNATATGPPYPRVGWEQILRLQPEVVIITSMAGGQSPAELQARWQRWPQLTAVQTGRVHIVDADLFDRPTHRLVDGLEILTSLIHSW